MVNCDAQGVRYTVFSFNELADWCNEDLFYGSQARDLSYEAALEELKAEAERAYVNLLEEAAISAAESGADREPGFNLEDYEEKWFEFKNHEYDKADFIALYVERQAENIQIDEPIIEGTLDGIEYRISWLGGAPLCWITKGLLGFGHQLCSPCVPGAVDGGGGFELATMPLEEVHRDHDGYLCHCPPAEWIRL